MLSFEHNNICNSTCAIQLNWPTPLSYGCIFISFSLSLSISSYSLWYQNRMSFCCRESTNANWNTIEWAERKRDYQTPKQRLFCSIFSVHFIYCLNTLNSYAPDQFAPPTPQSNQHSLEQFKLKVFQLVKSNEVNI